VTVERRKMLIVYVDETDVWEDLPLYEAIVRRLVRLQVRGATVQAGIMGYGSNARVHRKRLFGVSDDRPVVISVVDSEEKLRGVLPEIRAMIKEGLVLLTDVEVILG
jgi:PII-like signaling protein